MLVQLGQVHAGRVMKFTSAKDITTKAATIKAYVREANLAVEALAIVEHETKYHWLSQLSGDKAIRMMGLVDIGETRGGFPTSPTA